MKHLDEIRRLTLSLCGPTGGTKEEDEEYLRLYGLLESFERRYADRYAECIADGCSPSLADMLASASPPGCVTDATFLAGHCNGSQFSKTPGLGNRLREIAESQGQSTSGKVYLGSLAKYPGDPEAWVDGRGDVKRVCEKRGWGCDGAVRVAPRDVGRLPNRKAPRGSLAGRLRAAGLNMAG